MLVVGGCAGACSTRSLHVSRLLLNDPTRMDRKEISRRILDFTLEIISLLSGEDYTIVKKTTGGTPVMCKSGGWSRIPMTEPPSLIHEQKILELTHKIIELLTGEVPIRCQDVSVYFTMEEWEYIEGHQDLYKEAMMEEQPPLTSPDGLVEGNPPERCPRPLYSQDCPEEKVPESPQVDGAEPYTHLYRGVLQSFPTCLLYCTELLQMTNQEEDLTDIKVEEEEERMMDDPSCKSEVEEDVPGDVTTENPSKNTEGSILFSTKLEDEDQLDENEIIHTEEKLYSCSQCGKYCTEKTHLCIPKRIQIGEKPYSCSECGKRFAEKSKLVSHERSHTVEQPFLCPICGKCFTDRSKFVIHQRNHTLEKRFPCSLCGRSFTGKSSLIIHERIHTGEKPYSCSLCGKCFTKKSNLVTHERSHTGEKPYSCLECGKCFTKKSNLVTHERSHTGEKPFSCSLCGKCFIHRSHLVTHERIHTGEKPYSCSLCGKGFIEKSKLVIHERIHTGEKPYPCSECGKCFVTRAKLGYHLRIHTGEKPFTCSECGKYFITKSRLCDHQKIHTGAF